jgi:hypothetical protein
MIQTAVVQRNRTAWEDNSERIRLLHHEESWEALENLRDNVMDDEGQFISLNVAEPLTESLPEMFYAALQNTRWEESLQFSLPVILQNNPRVTSPFINRAILWQRLCDLLIIDDTPYRETVLVLENVDQASPVTQHEIARLIRFHELHSIRRTFVLTLNNYSHQQIIPELQDIFDQH